MTQEQKVKFIEQFLESIQIDELDVIHYYNGQDITSYNELYELIEDGNGFDVDIIYYSRAIEYLKENDSSLHESMNIATELCYSPENLSSEILASLLASQQVREDFASYESDIDEFFELLNEIADFDLDDIYVIQEVNSGSFTPEYFESEEDAKEEVKSLQEKHEDATFEVFFLSDIIEEYETIEGIEELYSLLNII